MANYQSIHTGGNIDYVISNALLKADAASIYLTKNDATSTYLTKNDASSIYITQTNANNSFPTKTGGGASGTWGINISGSSASCTGNAATATKATQDGNGNNIVNTYCTKNSWNIWFKYSDTFWTVVAENGSSVTVPSGKTCQAFYGVFGLLMLHKQLSAGTSFSPTNSYWGSDPAPGITKYMYYYFY